ncbi:MAG: GDP-mannose 4,6-dehydratase [Terriglobia bacterium]|jgi:UDP-glucuronate 4-epimerase
MDNILVTGGAGFIGSHLAERLLREGKRLAILDNLDDFYPEELKRANLDEVKASGEFQFFPTDIRDGAKLREVFAAFKPDAVIHLAARPGVRRSFAEPEAYTTINVLGTTQVLEISRQSGVQRIVLASSSSVYGDLSRAPFREDATISHPLSIYAATKVAGEAVAFTYSHAYPISVVCLRLFTVYGPRQRPDLAIRKFAGMIMEGKEVPIFGDGSLERDYTYVDDTVDGILRALDAPGKFDVFNLGNAHPVRIDEMLDTLGRALGKPVRRKFVPTPAGEMLLTHADLTKARDALGYSPRVNFEEGIRRFAEWMKSRA